MILLDSTPTNRTGTINFDIDAVADFVLPMAPEGHPWIKCATNTAFQATLSANVDLDGIVVYQTVAI